MILSISCSEREKQDIVMRDSNRIYALNCEKQYKSLEKQVRK